MTPPDFPTFLLRELWSAYLAARKGKKHTIDEHRFELNDMENLIDLRDSILRRYYHPSRGVAFIIQDPVIREIVAAPFRDRVIHHFLFNICSDWWDRRFIPDSYSCRKGKGTLYGQKRLARHLRQATANYTRPAFVAKLDIQGYFMSLNHDRLYRRVLWGLDQQFYRTNRPDPDNGIRCAPKYRHQLYHLLCYLWKEIIYDRPMDGIAIRGKRSDWRKLPRNKSLFHQPPGQGIVIGNLTSQLLSNIFLDQLDRFVVHQLGYPHYGRYVDDFYILVPLERREQLLRDVTVIRDYLQFHLGLTLHPKKRYYQTVDHGVPFIGATVYPGYIVPSKRAKRKAYQAAYRLATNGEGEVEGMVSRMGCLVHINSRRFFKQLFDTFGWDYDWTPDPTPPPDLALPSNPTPPNPAPPPETAPPNSTPLPLFPLPTPQPKSPRTRRRTSKNRSNPPYTQTSLML